MITVSAKTVKHRISRSMCKARHSIDSKQFSETIVILEGDLMKTCLDPLDIST